jgi:hypothetical protein
MISCEHREGCRDLQSEAEEYHTLDRILQGAVSSTEKSTLGLGILKLVITRENHSYRTQEAIYVGPEEADVGGAQWVTIKPNASLRSVIREYGERLLAFNSTRSETTFELFAVEVFEASARSTRILVRNAPDAKAVLNQTS